MNVECLKMEILRERICERTHQLKRAEVNKIKT